MKSQIKRFSKSTLSVLLSICMLISCMTVGIIATDAAKVSEDTIGTTSFTVYWSPSATDISNGRTFKLNVKAGGSEWVSATMTDTGKTISSNAVYSGTVSLPYDGFRVLQFQVYNGDDWESEIKPVDVGDNGWISGTSLSSYNGKYYNGSSWVTPSYDAQTYTVSASAGSNGSAVISSSSPVTGSSTSLSFNNGTTNTVYVKATPNDYYKVSSWSPAPDSTTTSGNTVTAQFNNVSAATTISVTFTEEPVYGVAGTKNLTGGTDDWDATSSDNDMTAGSNNTYTKVFSNKAAGNYEFKITKNRSWDVSYGYNSDNTTTSITGLASNNGSSTGNNVKFTTSASSNITITFNSSTHAITVNAVSNLSQLAAPTTVTLNGSAADCEVDTTTVGAKIRLAWSRVTNAGSYKVYKGNDLVAENITNLYYDIERAYSSTGSYSVVAVPSNTSAYSESNKSTARTLTVNKSQLNTPTVSVSPTDIKNGDSVELLVTDTNSSFTAAQFNYYYYTGNAVTISDPYKITAGTAKTLYPTADTTYKVCAYPVNGTSNDYYTQSYTANATEVTVSTPVWYLTGDMVTGQGGDTGWPTAITTYPVNTFVSHNIFYRSVTISGGGSSDKHYFRLTNQSNQYTVASGTDTDMATHDSSSTAVIANTTGTNGAMYVTGNGTFKVYVDQTTSGSPKVWVVSNEWSLTTTAYYQTFNLSSDSHNTPQEGTTGGTVPGNVEVTKGSSTTLTATPASGYTFDGWYTSSDFTSATKVSGSASYTFIPSANGDYYALFKQNTPAHYNVTLSFTSEQVNLSATYNGRTISTNGATLSVPVGASVSYSMSAKTGAQITARAPSNLITSNSGSFTMPAAATTISVTSSWINYNLTGVVSPAHGNVKFYSDSGCTTQITSAIYQQTVYAKYTPADGYQLHNFTTSGAGITNTSTSGNVFTFKMGFTAATITAHVILQYSVKYYVDMHDNTISGTPQIAIVTTDSGNTVATDANGAFCQANLTCEGNSKVYSATVNTPVTQSGSGYSAVYVKITATLNGTAQSHVESLATNHISTVINTHEVWFEAKNEASQPLALSYQTNSTTSVVDGYRRIYLAKPYSWQNSEAAWENIGIYHWGDYNDIGWNYGIKMHYLGYSGTGENDYHYYYVDIPKALDSTGQTVVTGGTGNKVSNIIFQGWGTNTTNGNTPSAQTGNIENIADSANFFVLSKDGNSFKGTAADSVTIPNYTRYISDVKMNISEATAVNLTPTYTGERVSFTSSNTGVVTVDPSTGVLTPVARGTATITVKIYGTIGSLLTGNITNDGDCRSYDVSVSVSDPSKFENFNPMALESKTYTVNIPAVSGNQPGYFDMDNVVMTVTGIQGVEKSTSSAIITQTATTNVDSIGTVCTAFTVKYAKANNDFSGYDGIQITGNIVTKSIRRSGGDRYGHKEWTPTDFTTSRVINGGVETATTANLLFDAAQATYSALFEAYQYVDVTFNFNYYEYKPEVDDNGTPEDSSDDMINYPYDAAYAGTEDRTDASFDTATHNYVEYQVEAYEVRNLSAANISAQANDYLTKLVNAAGQAIEVKPDNNYYNYQISGATITVTDTNTGSHTATVTVNMTHSVKQYKVYVNGTQASGTYAYQEYATVSHNSDNMWYGVTSRSDNDTSNAPLLATGSEYKFRVKGNTYLRTATGTVTDNNFNRSEVGFSHYETTHQENSQHDVVEYLLQNFYIADFFSPAKVLDPNSNNGLGNLPYDDAKFVGGGVVYYSMNGVKDSSSGTPTANALNSGYVVNKNNDYVLDEDMVKEMLKSQILASVNSTNYSNVTDFNTLAAAIGTEDAMKVAYGTEIPVQQYTENGVKTGILFRYLPLETFSNNTDNWTNGVPNKDDKGNYYTTLNNNTFRYSNSLQSYQYIYASGNENKETNSGKNMRLYSYYVYSYVAYNQETNVPETKYEIVLSDNYSDASTYWNGSTTE